MFRSPLLACAFLVTLTSSVAAQTQPQAEPAIPPAAPPAATPPSPPMPAPPLAVAPAPAPAVAAEQLAPMSVDGTRSSAPFSVHAFVSQGFILTTGNNYIAPDTKHGSFHFSEVGLNVTKELASKLRMGIQAFAQNFALGGDFNFKVDWFYLDYRLRDWLGLRVGRLKIPFGLYNEVNDVDSARVPILLPQSVYPIQTRSFLFAQTGFELYGFARSRSLGALEYRLYAGSIFIDPAILRPAGAQVELDLYVRYVVGGRLFWETPLEGLRLGGSVLAVHMDVTAFAGGMAFPIRNRSLLGTGSAEYAHGPMVLTAEYSRWHADQESVLPASNLEVTSERMYAMVTYRMTPWLQPALYYALFFPDVADREGTRPCQPAGACQQNPNASRQDDVALALRFDVTPNWIVKAEGHYMVGTAGLGTPLTVTPLSTDAARHWGVFLLKSTGYF